MATWSDTNDSCVVLWTTLFSLHQLQTSFKDSGDVKMKDLLFFTPLDPIILNQQAMMLANQLDKTFRNASGAGFESGITATIAIKRMVSFLISEDKTVNELAAEADACYKFFGE